MASRAPVRLPQPIERLLAWAHVDWEPPLRQPSAARVVLATILSVIGSLVADALLVAIGTHVFPSTRGFAHFRFGDYGSLTVVGVVVACAAWPIVTRVTSTPRWLFFRLAILITLVLWVPDLWILKQGEPAKAVAVLMAMHLAIAFVTYNVLVSVAPIGRRRQAMAGGRRQAMAGGRRQAMAGAPEATTGDQLPMAVATTLPQDLEDPEPSPSIVDRATPPFTRSNRVRLCDQGAVTAAVPVNKLVAHSGKVRNGGMTPRSAAVGGSTAPSSDRSAPSTGQVISTSRVPANRGIPSNRRGGAEPGGRGEGILSPDTPTATTFDRAPSSVARPPTSLAEPMSAVRVLPRSLTSNAGEPSPGETEPSPGETEPSPGEASSPARRARQGRGQQRP